MRGVFFSLAAFALIVLVAAVHDMDMKSRSLPTGLSIIIQDKATGEGVETGMGGAPYQTGKYYGPSRIDLGDFIKTAKVERVAISFDVISTINDWPASIMAHYTIDNAGAETTVDLPLLVSGPNKMQTEWNWVKLDDRLQTAAYLTGIDRNLNL